jgi:hypothetical protein
VQKILYGFVRVVFLHPECKSFYRGRFTAEIGGPEQSG